MNGGRPAIWDANCTRDEGRPFEVGNQVLISSYRKLLLPKAMVVSVAEKSARPNATKKLRRIISAYRGKADSTQTSLVIL